MPSGRRVILTSLFRIEAVSADFVRGEEDDRQSRKFRVRQRQRLSTAELRGLSQSTVIHVAGSRGMCR